MGFSDAEDNKPAHTIQLKSGIEAQKVLLPVHKFSNVESCKNNIVYSVVCHRSSCPELY